MFQNTLISDSARSDIGIATGYWLLAIGYWLVSPAKESRWGGGFPLPSKPTLGSTQRPVQ